MIAHVCYLPEQPDQLHADVALQNDSTRGAVPVTAASNNILPARM
jgi:hypothetical protein